MLRTSVEPMPRTLELGRAVAMFLAMVSVLEMLRPMMQALAPRWTIARTWALQIEPAPPVQNTTLSSGRGRGISSMRAIGGDDGAY